MEYVDGCTLADVIASHGKLDAEIAVGVMELVTEAVATLHDAEVIHRGSW